MKSYLGEQTVWAFHEGQPSAKSQKCTVNGGYLECIYSLAVLLVVHKMHGVYVFIAEDTHVSMIIVWSLGGLFLFLCLWVYVRQSKANQPPPEPASNELLCKKFDSIRLKSQVSPLLESYQLKSLSVYLCPQRKSLWRAQLE